MILPVVLYGYETSSFVTNARKQPEVVREQGAEKATFA